MAEEQKPVEVKETTPATALATETPAIETKPAETATEAPAAAAAPATIEETPATTTETTAEPAATEAAPVEEAKKEVTPVEEGHLEHKGVNFPKNLIFSKDYFWFGSDAVEHKSLSSYIKSEKSTETAHHNAAWASHTGKGLLFFGDKAAPQGVINLADASEPAVDGANKFHFIAKGHKHVFKAANVEDRDNWISQLKSKITEAKELASTITETEAYKAALETLKPAKKEEKKEEKAAESPAAEPAAATEAPVADAVSPATEAPAAEATATPAVEDPKKEEPKRRSASRKRASLFGNLLGKKEEKKEEEVAVPAVAETPKEETPAVPSTEPVAAETPAAVEAPATEVPVAAATEAAAEDKPIEAPKEEKKPVPTKRNSIFGVFGKKEKKAAVAAEAEAAPPSPAEIAPASETAPVIPPVEATTPLAVDVANPSTVPVEVKETAPATNGEPRPELKEKRKSSLPFGFGKRDKSPAAKSPAHSDNEEGEKPEKTSAFSKLRATIKGRGKTEKPTDKLEKTEEKPEETPAVEATKPTESTPAAETSKATEEPENKPENVTSSTPAPVIAAA
ncbi:hypothetical protein Cob_v006759 [Colletotrichum orbiculare MAFF 240422]|uniref:Uncharacterized protein n=1 Tax=Colletotrichum orbiculare (strain 104-T / ATCC 96160 / CBS 514.97 / LARS 414 / MAFF 240422) TaxID=1213857 RepID=N4UQB3_COLOR|nr:hypothetical protein Cob_v006759 [Colletotrichum orbiculare MAFF 240422]